MKTTNRQAGFSAIEGLLIVFVLVAVGAVGYFALNRTKNASQSAGTTTPSSTASSAPQIKNTSDLTDAEKTVDTTELDASSSDLDAELNKF